MCKRVRGLDILLILGEEPQTLCCGVDGHLKSDSNDLNVS